MRSVILYLRGMFFVSLICGFSIAVLPAHANSAPMVIAGECEISPTESDSEILAIRLLFETGDLLVDEERLQRLADEIADVLERVRTQHPRTENIHARSRYMPRQLLMKLEPELYDVVAGILEDGGEPVPLDTGFQQFDELNGRLGLSIVDLFDIGNLALLCFDEHVNVEVAMVRYTIAVGVTYAEPNSMVGDGPDIEVRKDENEWSVNFIDAWGDCPAGCIHRETFSFIVRGTEVR